MRLGEDYDLYARALSLGAKMRLIPWTGYVSVMRSNSLSLNHDRRDLAALAAADDRLLASGRISAQDARLVKQHRFSINSRITWIDFMTGFKGGKPLHVLGVILRMSGRRRIFSEYLLAVWQASRKSDSRALVTLNEPECPRLSKPTFAQPSIPCRILLQAKA